MIGHIRSEKDRHARIEELSKRASRISAGSATMDDLSSPYGWDFDEVVREWEALENGHDLVHPNRDECGGVGACVLMRRAHELEQQMIELVNDRRVRLAQAARRG